MIHLKTSKTINVIGRILTIALVVLIIATICFYLFQDKIIFRHEDLPKDFTFKFDRAFEEYFIKTEDAETLDALLFKAQKPSKGLILYFHGNSNNLERWGRYSTDFTQLGYDVLMVDYRGYGKSTGKPGETDFYKDARTVLAWAQVNIPFTRLVIYGRSLGSAVASNLAMSSQPYLLILETPFDDLDGVTYAPPKPVLFFFPLRYHFPNKIFLQKVACKKVIFHGTKDRIVPLSSALRLKPLLHEGDLFIIIQGGTHRNLRDFEEYHRVLADVLK